MTFSRYEALLVAMLTIVQFTVVLDFAVMAPLGAELIDSLNISTKQFGILVSAYALSAGASVSYWLVLSIALIGNTSF